jgi:glutathione S-transferase
MAPHIAAGTGWSNRAAALPSCAIVEEQMRIVWGRANSSNVMKVIWGLEELGLPYERRDVGGPFGQTDTPEYRAMNPNQLVPTLQEDAFALWESNAILRYLCNAHAPETPLWPRDQQARANVDRWMDWQQTAMNTCGATVFQGLVRTPPERRDTMAIERATVDLTRVWSMLDAQLAKHDHVAGPEFSLADIPLGVHVHRWFFFPIAKPELPHLRAWYDRLLARPAYRQHVGGPVT